MHARVTTVSADGPALQKWREVVTGQIAPRAGATPGFVSGVWLLDEQGERAFAITFWTSQEALDAAEKEAAANRDRLGTLTGGTVEVARCQVVAQAEVRPE